MEEYTCPITLELMKDPVLLAGDGETYERTAIQEWLRTNNTSPLTGAVLTAKTLVPNRIIKRAIDSYLATLRKPAAAAKQQLGAKYAKGDLVEHFREIDKCIRRGTVVAVHLDNPTEGAYYTLKLQENDQELQTVERKLDLPGRWAQRMLPNQSKFSLGTEVETEDGSLRGTIVSVFDEDVVDGISYVVSGSSDEKIREEMLDLPGKWQQKREKEMWEKLELEQQRMREEQEKLRQAVLELEHKRRIQAAHAENDRRAAAEERRKREKEEGQRQVESSREFASETLAQLTKLVTDAFTGDGVPSSLNTPQQRQQQQQRPQQQQRQQQQRGGGQEEDQCLMM